MRFPDEHQASSVRLSISVIGPLASKVGGQTIVPINRKSRALLGYLAVADLGEETRERLVGLLWSEMPEGRARGSLRQAIRDIRKALETIGFDGVTADRSAVRLDRSKTDVDLWEVIEEAKSGRVHPLLLQSEEPFEKLLAEFETIDPAFRVWLVPKRQSLSDRLTRLLETAMRSPGVQPSQSLLLARALLSLDPTHEEAARTLILSLARSGDMGGAFGMYRKLWDLLEEEYDVEPSAQTQDLIAALRLEQPPPASTVPEKVPPVPTIAAPPKGEPILLTRRDHIPSPSAIARKIVVAIGAFESAGVFPNQKYLVDGFRRELIACLVRFREWLICDGPGLASSPVRVPNADGEYVIEANATADADSVRLTLTLRETATGIYLWSERLQLSMDNWLHAQQLVIRRLTAALNVQLSAGRLKSLVPGPSDDLLAYDQWLRGQALFFEWSPASWYKATEVFQDIIARHPAFAPAYSSLAQLQNTIHFVHPGVFRNPQRTDQALAYARESANLDPIDSRAHLSLGWAYATANHHGNAALHHQLACELNENDPWTVVSAGLGFAFRGQVDRAKALADQALSLALTPSPSHWRYQSMIRYICGEHEASVAAADRAGGSVVNILAWKTAALNQLGRRKDAETTAEAFFNAVQSRWFADEPPTREAMSRWIMHAFPIENQDVWERLRNDFGRAGAPVEGIAHYS